MKHMKPVTAQTPLDAVNPIAGTLAHILTKNIESGIQATIARNQLLEDWGKAESGD